MDAQNTTNELSKTSDLRRKIVAIGGGEIGGPRADGNGHYPIETTAIDMEIFLMTGKTAPTLLFIPTASSDSQEYYEVVRKHFLNIGFWSVDVLYLSDKSLTNSTVRQMILSHDAVYVGGGNTLRMMTVWRKLGVDKLLRQAMDRGIVLAGISAGAMCWFSQGYSDKRKTASGRKTIAVTGLGFLPAINCPHYNVDQGTQADLKSKLKGSSEVAICLDDCAALVVVGDTYKIISSRAHAMARKAFWEKDIYTVEEVSQSNTPGSLPELLTKTTG